MTASAPFEAIDTDSISLSNLGVSEGTKIRCLLSSSPAGFREETPQDVHTPFLPSSITGLPGQRDSTEMTVHSGGTQAYHDWLQQLQGDSCFFGVQLVGDAQQMSEVSCIAFNDLAFYT